MSEIPGNNAPNDPRQNEKTAIVRTKERKNDTIGTKEDPGAPQAPEATNTPDVDRQNDAADKIPQRSDERSDEKLANSAVLARKGIQAMENLYLEHGDSYSEISDTFGGYSKSAISRHLGYLVDDPEKERLHQQNRKRFHGNENVDVSNDQQPHQNSAVEPTASNQQPSVEPRSTIPTVIWEDSDGTPSFPRVNAEVYGPRPRIVEENNNNGYDDSESTVPTAEAGTPRPIKITVDGRHPSIQAVFFQLLHLATARGLSLEAYLASETCSQDFRDLALAKTAIVGAGESFRSNLLTMMKKAVAFDKARRESGLISDGDGMMEDEL